MSLFPESGPKWAVREALERIIRASQGNFDHLMGQLKRVAQRLHEHDIDIADLQSGHQSLVQMGGGPSGAAGGSGGTGGSGGVGPSGPGGGSGGSGGTGGSGGPGPSGPSGPSGDPGMEYEGPWDVGANYRIGDVVVLNGSVYICTSGGSGGSGPSS